MWQAVGWICALVAMSCGAVPDIGVIETAYEREVSAGSALHDKDLQVLHQFIQQDSIRGRQL